MHIYMCTLYIIILCHALYRIGDIPIHDNVHEDAMALQLCLQGLLFPWVGTGGGIVLCEKTPQFDKSRICGTFYMLK